MAQRIMWAALVFSAMALSFAHAETQLNVMSFNIRCGTSNDGENAWANRRDIVVDMVRTCAPDIIGVQECITYQADYIVAALPEYRWIGVGREAKCNGEHMAVLYRTKILAPIETGNFWLSETPDVPGSRSWETNCPRMVTWARFRDLRNGASFYFFNTHLDHVSEQARQEGAKLVAARIAALAPGVPALLTGDFNSTAEASEAYRILTETGLQDAWKLAAKQEGPVGTCSGFRAPQQGDNARIDWILIRGKASVDRCETLTFNRDGRYPSDHYPVMAALTLAGE